MLNISLNEEEIEKRFLLELEKRLNEIQHRTTFWDMKELIRQTNMSENFIKEKFFYDERFPKYKIGNKWYFPAKEAERFLIQWIKEQSKH